MTKKHINKMVNNFSPWRNALKTTMKYYFTIIGTYVCYMFYKTVNN